MVYAAVAEDTLEYTVEILRRQSKPCGVLISNSMDMQTVEDYKQANHPVDIEASSVFLNFADDTYILARHTRMLEYELSVLRATMKMFGQHLHVDKCEDLTDHSGGEPKPRPRTWTTSEMKIYLAAEISKDPA